MWGIQSVPLNIVLHMINVMYTKPWYRMLRGPIWLPRMVSRHTTTLCLHEGVARVFIKMSLFYLYLGEIGRNLWLHGWFIVSLYVCLLFCWLGRAKPLHIWDKEGMLAISTWSYCYMLVLLFNKKLPSASLYSRVFFIFVWTTFVQNFVIFT